MENKSKESIVFYDVTILLKDGRSKTTPIAYSTSLFGNVCFEIQNLKDGDKLIIEIKK